MEVGVAIWIRDDSQSWVEATIVEKIYGDGSFSIKVSVEGGDKRDLSFSTAENTSDLDGIKLRNEERESVVEDLISLPYLHEPAILHCLHNRYIDHASKIYTWTGVVGPSTCRCPS